MIKPEIYQGLGLSDAEYEKIIQLIGREPTITELAIFSVEWSEHCGYPSSRKWLGLLPKEGKYPTLVGEDSGGIVLDDLAIIFKMESHNHPSQVEPKQGAATGVGGIIRDIFTAGARPIASLNSLRFGPLDDPYNRYLLSGVVDGIQFYGNCLGVPTVGGEIYFDESYTGNCLVNAMSIGIAKKQDLHQAKASGAGNLILYAGAATGRDGIGGCSILASQEFQQGEQKRPSVQIGDPFTEKCLIEATLESLTTEAVVGIKDMGAAGLTCSVSEMASAGKVGVEIELADVPRREEGMQPWEVMMSESQERMLLCVKKGQEKQIQDIFSKWGLNAVVIGKVTDDHFVRVKNNQEVVAQLKAETLAKAPLYDRSYNKPDYLKELKQYDINCLPACPDYNQSLMQLLASPSIASKEWVYRQYDHMVQTNTVLLPGSDAAVLRIKDRNKAIAATTDCNSRYCYLNPYRGAQIAVAEAARNLVCSGAQPAAVTDCLNFGNPGKPDRFWQFKNCVQGLADACSFFNLSVVSGNVSFYNENPRGAVYPTPTIGMLGIIDDLQWICSQYFKSEDQVILLLGDCYQELGGSEYLYINGIGARGEIPKLNLAQENSLHKAVNRMTRKKLLSSAHDCSEGGLAVALAECCISNKEKKVGAIIDNLPFDLNPAAMLFGESQSRIIISTDKKNIAAIEKIAGNHKISCNKIGTTGGDRFIIDKDKHKLIDLSLEQIAQAWSDALRRKIDCSC